MIDYYDTSITATSTTAFTTDGVILDISESVILTPWEFGGPITVEAYININSTFSFTPINVNIVSSESVQVDGVDTTLVNRSGWNTFVITSIDTTDPEFLNRTYKIEWTNPAGTTSNQHGGYFLSYDGLSDSDSQIRNGGPIWWWYNQTSWRPYEGGATVSVSDSVRYYNELLIEFTSYTTYRVSRDDGTTWYNVPSQIGTYPDTLLFKYKMYPGYTSAHSFVMSQVGTSSAPSNTTDPKLINFGLSNENDLLQIKTGPSTDVYLNSDNSIDATETISNSYQEWMHITYVFDETSIRAYKNGTLDSNTTNNETITTSTRSFNYVGQEVSGTIA